MHVLDIVQMLIGPDKATVAWWQMCIRAVIIFAVGLAIIRISGARTFTRGSPLETVVAIIFGSNLSRALTGNAPFWPVILATILLVLLHALLAQAAIRSRLVAYLVKRPPVTLAKEGLLDRRQMSRQGVDEGDVDASLREHGVTELEQVRLAMLERDGKISVVKA